MAGKKTKDDRPMLIHRQVAELQPYARNSRTHSKEQVAQIAASIQEFGFLNPVLVDAGGQIIAGHGRVLAAQQLGLAEVPCLLVEGLSEAQIRAYVIADNKLAENAGWDNGLLAGELAELRDGCFDLDLLGFSLDELALLMPELPGEGLTDPDDVPDLPEEPVSKLGDIWLLGRHRLMCGDSTDPVAVRRLMNGKKAALLHADPPYGMSKEKDGVENDNLYRDKLTAFQMQWWSTCRPHLVDNAGAYIWGNAEELWRLWYVGGLADSERFTFRNEIVWDKGGGGFGVGTEAQRCFFPEERCLFFMLGEQGFNANADSYWEGWEPIRSYLDSERVASGLSNADCNRICGKQNMTQAAFTRGGFRLILREDYEKLHHTSGGQFFKRDYDELKRDFYATRAYFDNTHDNMTDVWRFGRVTGAERYGHATPKPVAIMERVMKSSLEKYGISLEPFNGSGSTLIGAEKTDRTCYAMELTPAYIDVTVKRWENFTGKKAVLCRPEGA